MAITISCRQSIFWFNKRVVLANFLFEVHTVNAEYYCALLSDGLRPAIRSNRPGLLEKGIILQNDSAPPCDRPIRQSRKLKRWAGNCYSICHTVQTQLQVTFFICSDHATNHLQIFKLKTMKMFNSMHQKISTWCQQKLNPCPSSQLVEQWKRCRQIMLNINITVKIVRFTVVV